MNGLLTQKTAYRDSALVWKDTPIGRVPADWEVLPIADLLEKSFSGEWGIEPSGHGGDVLVLRSTNIDDDGSIDYSTAAPRYLSPSKVAGKRLQTGDVLLESSGGGPAKPVGRVAPFVQPTDGRSYVCSNFFRTLRPRRNEVHPTFLFWRLLSLYREPRIWRYQQQTTGIINLTMSEYLMALVAVPGRPEQERISETLERVNAALDVSRALVAKHQRLHAGLINTLLTRGIDNDGRVRSEATHSFKVTELGRFPAEWNLRPLKSLLLGSPRNGVYKPPSQIGEGTLMVGQQAFTPDDSLDLDRARRAEATSEEVAMFGLREGDILMTRVYAVPEGVGRSVLVPKLSESAVYESNMMRLRVDRSAVLPYFLHLTLRAPSARRHLDVNIKRSNQSSLSQAGLTSLVCAVPEMLEQKRIVNALRASETVITALQRETDKLARLKAGLVQALLSGRVRIAPDAAGL